MWGGSKYGLGGGGCRDVLRDGTAQEMVGRLCVLPNRNASIGAAARAAEARFGGGGSHEGASFSARAQLSRQRHVAEEAKQWRIVGPMRTRFRKLVAADSEDARRWARGMAQGVPEEGRGLRKRDAGKGRGARGAKGGRQARGGGGKGSGRKRFPWQ